MKKEDSTPIKRTILICLSFCLLIPNSRAITRSSLPLKCPPDDQMPSWPGVPQEEMPCPEEVTACDVLSLVSVPRFWNYNLLSLE